MASDDFYLVLPSNSSMSMYPNNTLAQYVTNLPRRISLSGEWECGLTEIHYPHDWYNVRGARLTVEHDGKMDHHFIIRQPLCPVVGRRPQHAVSKLPCLVLSSAISCRSSICPGRLSIAWLVSLVVFSCHMVSNW